MNADHNHSHARNRFAVIPTPQRLLSDPDVTGKGITIAFIDAGFYPHPDLTQPENRIVAYVDVSNPEAVLDADRAPESWDWHGTQTSVSAAGNGFLSNGIYRGLACHSRLVLVKVSDHGKITEDNIARGFEWVLANQEPYNIRIISISLGGDEDVPYQTNRVDLLAEEAIRRGIVVVVAAGNSGCTNQHYPVPPATAPSVITVGGYDDKNLLDPSELALYCSSFGPTADGFQKPEIIAPAIWIAAPILPKTTFFRKAEVLSEMTTVPDYELPRSASQFKNEAELPDAILGEKPEVIRAYVEKEIRQAKVVATHYQHVDGTSFSAPIVASVVAQMLETNPHLTPALIKQILVTTADRLRNAPLIRQGYGMLNANAALEAASHEMHMLQPQSLHAPHISDDKMTFFYHDDTAQHVTLVGDFNNWNLEATPLTRQKEGIWRGNIPIPVAGLFRYKFVINGEKWVDDPTNPLKEPDNYGGFNSILNVSQWEVSESGNHKNVGS